MDVGNNNTNKNNNNQETKLKITKITIMNACNEALNTLEQFTNYKMLLKPGTRLCRSRRDLFLHLNIKPLFTCDLEKHFAMCPRYRVECVSFSNSKQQDSKMNSVKSELLLK